MASRTILDSTLSHSLARLRFWRASRRRRRRWLGLARGNDAATLQNGIRSAAKGPTRRLRLDRVIVLCLVLISSLLAVLVGSFRHRHRGGGGLLTQCPSGWKEGGAQSLEWIVQRNAKATVERFVWGQQRKRSRDEDVIKRHHTESGTCGNSKPMPELTVFDQNPQSRSGFSRQHQQERVQ